MALKIQPALAKLLYGFLFVALLPAALAGWAHGARVNVSLPALESTRWGMFLSGAGVLLWCAGVLALRLKGGGLPMNAFPPPKLVTGGVYGFTGHPIYAGFTIASLGVAVSCGSVAAQWLVTPIVALAAGALWWGYERTDLYTRLGAPRRAACLSVPLSSDGSPYIRERIGSLVLALAVPSLSAVMLYGSGLAGSPPYLQTDPRIRAWITLVIMIGAVLAARTSTDLRQLVLTSWVGSLLLTLFVLILPAGPFGGQLPIAPDAPFLSLVAVAGLMPILGRIPRCPSIARWALVLSSGLFLLSRDLRPSLDSGLGAVAFLFASTRWRWWRAALRGCEKVANCWRECNFGTIRIIHIGWLAALPAFGGAACAVVLVGPAGIPMILGAFVFLTVGAALWAQYIEGSPALSRPYGFFGALFAVIFFAVAAAPFAFDTSPWLVLGCFATVAPYSQGLARLRCFANGCCHGAPCVESCGVIYRNPRTRVVRLANLGGIPIHPTQLYSMTGNFLIGALMMRLWAEKAPLAILTGLYFSLTGLARFVEEAWRGEPQTPVAAGLRLYQWISVALLVAGAAVTAIPGSPRAPTPVLSLSAIWTGLAVGVVTWAVVSIDFPHSRKRFARLA